jgi:hypothetical protein
MNNQQKYFNKFKRDLEFIFDKLEDVDFESDRISIKTKSKNRSLQELYIFHFFLNYYYLLLKIEKKPIGDLKILLIQLGYMLEFQQKVKKNNWYVGILKKI